MSPPKLPLSGTGIAKPPLEKSKFAQTCNRLSLYLKEKGNIRDLNPRIFDAKATSFSAKAKTIDLLNNVGEKLEKAVPEYVILDSSCEIEDATKKAGLELDDDQSVTKPKTAQMTIFYQGQVLVLDDVPADRARDLMLMANNGRRKTENPVEPSKEAKDSDLPIARRASLHKFLAKRKDRATIRLPYQGNNQSPGGSSSGNEHSFDLNM